MSRRPYTRTPCGIYGPRNLVRRHTRRLMMKNASVISQAIVGEEEGEGGGGSVIEDEPPQLLPGQEQLFSFYQPSLEAGLYTVTVSQPITADGQENTLPNINGQPTVSKQKFEVVAPRYSLPDDAIHSSFPPQGYGALAKTLPHVVLTDPHLPWDRIASASPKEGDPEYLRNKVPWLALLVFTADELKLPASELSGNGGIFTGTSFGTNSVTQTQTFTINMNVVDVPNINSTITPIKALLPPDPSDDKTTDVILVPSKLFAELVTSYDKDGAPQSQTGPDVSRYKYLAHTRDINTVGMAEAGVEDNGVFGIVVSHRTGPLSNTQTQPVIAHLVSIEGIESTYMDSNWPINFDNTKYVALSSLYSWNFVTLPEGSFDIETTFVQLGEGLDLLRAPKEVIDKLEKGSRLQKRLEDGYTLTKYRTVTGEITAAINRGPLTPTLVPYPLLANEIVSNAGINLQIMDQEVGLMDITYSVAWQLGKTLAVADKSFATSLVKLRASIFNPAMAAAKAEILRGLKSPGYKSRGELIKNLPNTIPALKALHKATPGLHAPTGSMQDRWSRPQVEHMDLGYYSTNIQDIFSKHATDVGRRLMLSSDGDGTDNYDEHNTPSNIDWMIVLNWVLDKMFLYSIPAHYLIVDPSYLAPETLRFFHVDRNWTDALIDGALSLGNRLEGVDEVRKIIHGMIQAYLNPTPDEKRPKPQVPTYGFLLHSDAVTKYPDLKVDVVVTTAGDGPEKTPILRHDNLDVTKGVMLCLFDQVPGDPGLKSITFTEPPHQQSFIAGGELDSHHIKTLYKKIFTLPNQQPDPKPWETNQWLRPGDPNPGPVDQDPPGGASVPHANAVFKWGSDPLLDPDVRTLLLPAWADDVNNVLNYFGATSTPATYQDDYANAAMAGVQLNNPIYRLAIEYNSESGVTFPPTIDSGTVTPTPTTTAPQPEPGSTPSGTSGPPVPTPTRPSGTSGPPVPTPTRPTPTGASRTTQDPSGASPTSAPRVNSGFLLGPSHGPVDVPPPHQRPLLSGPGNPRSSETHSVWGAGQPQYSVKCFPLDNDPARPGIPGDGIYPKDLVFTIIQTSGDPTSDYNLQSMTIMFELAYNNTRYDRCLLDNYTGPGPTMLSNLRFFAQARIFDDPVHQRSMEIVVKPRTIKRQRTVTPDKSTDMSFILPVCDVLKHDPSIGIPVWITPAYLNAAPVTVENFYVIQLQQPAANP